MSPRVCDMVRRASNITDVSRDELLGQSRNGYVCRVRFAVMLAAKRRGKSSPQIGKALSRDHTTILNGWKRGSELLAADPSFAALVTEISR
jgi:chromosomal replication initiation ATPase DnaA